MTEWYDRYEENSYSFKFEKEIMVKEGGIFVI